VQVIKKQLNRVRIRDNWSCICQACDAAVQYNTSIPVAWIKPPPFRVKLNSDGSCVEGQCGGGGIIRDQEGNFIFAYTISLGARTSNIAEAEAMIFGLKWCDGKGFDMAMGETDSLLLAKCSRKE